VEEKSPEEKPFHEEEGDDHHHDSMDDLEPLPETAPVQERLSPKREEQIN